MKEESTGKIPSAGGGLHQLFQCLQWCGLMRRKDGSSVMEWETKSGNTMGIQEISHGTLRFHQTWQLEIHFKWGFNRKTAVVSSVFSSKPCLITGWYIPFFEMGHDIHGNTMVYPHSWNGKNWI